MRPSILGTPVSKSTANASTGYHNRGWSTNGCRIWEVDQLLQKLKLGLSI